MPVDPGEVFVAGTGSYAAEMADWARAAGLRVRELIELESAERIGSLRHGLPVIGLEPPYAGARAIVGIGGDRRRAWSQLEEHGWAPVTLVHPAATLAADVGLGAGTTVGPGAVVGAASLLEDQVIVSRGAMIGHHVSVGAFATVNPGANIGGNSRLGEASFLGMGATVVNGMNIGARAVVGAGALVLKDVDPEARVQGVPARVVTAETA
jgi:sugar O-acyltransferase (sialic acid O-acetyltransferase NeuD family)